jgi:6-phosphogluconate dehydrogenase
MTTDRPMQLGMVGLGRMGANLSRRLMRDGHRVVAYDHTEAHVKQLAGEGATGATTLEEFVAKLEKPRAAWVMLPASVTGQVVNQLAGMMEPGDTIIDGGNTYYRDDIDRAKGLLPQGIHYVDIGTSGGVFGLERGFCLMVGGETEVVQRLEPLLETIAPGVDAAPRTAGRTGPPSQAEKGYLHCGPIGAGHFVKMVHNGVEYGLMASYAEGLNILHKADVGKHQAEISAEITPLREPEYYQYEFNVADVAEVWRRGSVISSWLIDLTAEAFARTPDLHTFAGRVSDSGEGRWTVEAAIDEGVPAPVITAALYERFESRGLGEFTGKILSAMRSEFGGHAERKR